MNNLRTTKILPRFFLSFLVMPACGFSNEQTRPMDFWIQFEDGSTVQVGPDSQTTFWNESRSSFQSPEDYVSNFYRLTQEKYPRNKHPKSFFLIGPLPLYRDTSQEKQQYNLILNLQDALLFGDTNKFKELFPKVYPDCSQSCYPYETLKALESGTFQDDLALFKELPWQIAPGDHHNNTGVYQSEPSLWTQFVSGLPWCVSATFNGQKDILEYLISEKKADVNAKMDIRSDDGRYGVGHNALTAALSRFNVNCLQFLLQCENCDPNETIEVEDSNPNERFKIIPPSPKYPFLRIFSHHTNKRVWKHFEESRVKLELWCNTEKAEYEMLEAFLNCPKVDVTVQHVNNQNQGFSIFDLCIEKFREDCIWLLCRHYLKGKEDQSRQEEQNEPNKHYLAFEQVEKAWETVQQQGQTLNEQRKESLKKIEDMLSEIRKDSCTLDTFLEKFPENPRNYTWVYDSIRRSNRRKLIKEICFGAISTCVAALSCYMAWKLFFKKDKKVK